MKTLLKTYYKHLYNKKSVIIFDSELTKNKFNDFQKHESKFKHVLAELEQKISKNNFKEDYKSLFNDFYNRKEFINSKRDVVEDSDFDKFDFILQKLKTTPSISDISEIRNKMLINSEQTQNLINKSNSVKINEVKDLDDIVSITSTIFEKLNVTEIEFLLEFKKYNELFSLINLEPYIARKLSFVLF
jgi:hypothetical protein